MVYVLVLYSSNADSPPMTSLVPVKMYVWIQLQKEVSYTETRNDF